MKAIINYISESKKSAIIAVTTYTESALGKIPQTVSGFVTLPEGHSAVLKQEFEIAATKVTKDIRPNEQNPDKPFEWLVFS